MEDWDARTSCRVIVLAVVIAVLVAVLVAGSWVVVRVARSELFGIHRSSWQCERDGLDRDGASARD
jgi:hypothetical protein